MMLIQLSRIFNITIRLICLLSFRSHKGRNSSQLYLYYTQSRNGKRYERITSFPSHFTDSEFQAHLSYYAVGKESIGTFVRSFHQIKSPSNHRNSVLEGDCDPLFFLLKVGVVRGLIDLQVSFQIHIIQVLHIGIPVLIDIRITGNEPSHHFLRVIQNRLLQIR